MEDDSGCGFRAHFGEVLRAEEVNHVLNHLFVTICQERAQGNAHRGTRTGERAQGTVLCAEQLPVPGLRLLVK